MEMWNHFPNHTNSALNGKVWACILISSWRCLLLLWLVRVITSITVFQQSFEIRWHTVSPTLTATDTTVPGIGDLRNGDISSCIQKELKTWVRATYNSSGLRWQQKYWDIYNEEYNGDVCFFFFFCVCNCAWFLIRSMMYSANTNRDFKKHGRYLVLNQGGIFKECSTSAPAVETWGMLRGMFHLCWYTISRRLHPF